MKDFSDGVKQGLGRAVGFAVGGAVILGGIGFFVGGPAGMIAGAV